MPPRSASRRMTSRPTMRPCRSRPSSACQRQVGVSLVTRGGRRLGWIVPPARRTTLAVGWNGLIDGKLVPDGTYVVKLVYQSSVLATTTLHIDTHAPQLVLRADERRRAVRRRQPAADDDQPERRRVPRPRQRHVPAARAGDRHDGRHAHRQGAAHDLHDDEHARLRRAHADLGAGARRPTREPSSSASPPSTAQATASSTAPPNAFVGRVPERRRRARAGNRRRLRPAELRAGPGRAHPHRHRRTGALRCASSIPGPSRSSPTPTTRWPASTSGCRRRRSTGR